MADSVDEIIDDKVENEVAEVTEESDSGGETTVVVVDSGGDNGDAISAEALNVAEQVHEIAQGEAAEAASTAITVSLDEMEARLGHYPTRDEVVQLVAAAVAAGVTAAAPVVDEAETIADELPNPADSHFWYRPLKFGRR